MIVESFLCDVNVSCFFPIEGLAPAPVYVKCEAFNAAGSIKIKPAQRMIEDLETSGRLAAGGALIESSSGNLGVAISMIAAAKGYDFICVTDPNASEDSVKIMRALGAKVIIVREKDANGGYLGTRIALIRTMCAEDPRLVWVNQYANRGNWQSHFQTTAPDILKEFPRVDHLFIGAGTGGTLMGCARYFNDHSPATRIIAVDAEGSVTFGTVPGPRRVPGLGTSRRPEIIDDSLITSVVHVAEVDTIRMCRGLAKRGLLFGGSTGTVLAGVKKLEAEIKPSDIVVAIMPDLGFKYIDTIYNDAWVENHYGDLAEPEKEKPGLECTMA
jgi:N-(2-amino-2-carboxyethyl)-L-glutamate synthase